MKNENLNGLFLPEGAKRRNGIVWSIGSKFQLVIWPGTAFDGSTRYNYDLVEKTKDRTVLTRTDMPGAPVLQDGTYPENILSEICQECVEYLREQSDLYTAGAKHIQAQVGISKTKA